MKWKMKKRKIKNWKWKTQNEKWKNEKWKMKNEKQKTKNEKWKMKTKKWKPKIKHLRLKVRKGKIVKITDFRSENQSLPNFFLTSHQIFSFLVPLPSGHIWVNWTCPSAVVYHALRNFFVIIVCSLLMPVDWCL